MEKLSRETSAVKQDERRELKRWLTGLLPEGMSRSDVADELGVDRKTISTMLNPARTGFGNGLTMLLYLRLAGAVVEAPSESPGASRLAALEATVDRQGNATTSALHDLTARLEAVEKALGLRAPRARKAG
jgi:hypothetical protein